MKGLYQATVVASKTVGDVGEDVWCAEIPINNVIIERVEVRDIIDYIKWHANEMQISIVGGFVVEIPQDEDMRYIIFRYKYFEE